MFLFCFLFVVVVCFFDPLQHSTVRHDCVISGGKHNESSLLPLLLLDHTIRRDSQFISDATLMTEEHREEMKFNESYGQEIERQKSWRRRHADPVQC